MLTKAHKSFSENQCSKKDSKQCSVCKCCTKKTILFVCESGHVICAQCRTDDNAKDSKKDRGDFSNEMQNNCNGNQVVRTLKQHKSQLIHRNTNFLASGDCDKRAITGINRKSKSEHNIKSIHNSNEGNEGKNLTQDKKTDYIETSIEYKNVNFKDVESSESDLSAPLPLSEDVAKLKQNLKEGLASQVCPRPMVCPVLGCGKTIAMNSAMLHFHYDHPKVPKLLLTKENTQDTILKVSDITMNTQCLNIFLLQGKKFCKNIDKKVSSSDIRKETNFTPLLLMSARMFTKQIKSELNKKQYTKNRLNKDKADNNRDTLQENEMLLLWICNLEKPSVKYSVTLISKDKKHGLSYIGESVYIRKDQDAFIIFQNAESLVIHGPALNKILDFGILSVFFNILD